MLIVSVNGFEPQAFILKSLERRSNYSRTLVRLQLENVSRVVENR